MAERCAVIGVGQTHHKAKRDDVSIAGLVREAAKMALADADLTWSDIDAVVIGKAPDMFEGNMMPEIYLAPALGAVGNGVAVPGTGGDIATGGETAALVSNAGNVVLSATATGMLTDATGDTISFAQIATTSAANTLATTLAAPPLSNTTAAITVVAAANKLINADAKWTFAYANTAAVPGGTYGGVNLNNSRIVYTATMP